MNFKTCKRKNIIQQYKEMKDWYRQTWMTLKGIMLDEKSQIQSLHTVFVLVAQSYLTLCNPVNCSPPGSSVLEDSPGKNTGVDCHAFLQGIFPPRDWTHIFCIAGGFFTSPLKSWNYFIVKNTYRGIYSKYISNL